MTVVTSGAGAAGIAIIKLLMAVGLKNVIMCDSEGAIWQGRPEGMNPYKDEIAKHTNPNKIKGGLAEAIKGADVFIGVSAPNSLNEDMIRSMAKDPIVFAQANPIPEIWPLQRAFDGGAKVVATGRSDCPNQINNVLAFPGVFRGLLDARAHLVTEDMLIRAANAIASSSEATACMPSNGTRPPRVSTRLRRFGSARPSDSAVLRPISTGLPRVSALKRLRSSGRCQGKALPWPMAKLRSSAAISDTCMRVAGIRPRPAP